jgi:endonuclease-3
MVLKSFSFPLLRRRLEKRYGRREYRCWGKAVDVLVDTILSQNTSNANSDAGYKRLRRTFRNWNQVANAPVEEVEKAIRISGLSRIKAPRIQAILRQIKADRGKIELQFLETLDEDEAMTYLTQFKGIGEKTAACTLLFAFGKAVFPVDTHIHRIARRLELVPARANANQTQALLTPQIHPHDRYALHVLLITHGRQTCKAIAPRCDDCPILGVCPWGKQRARRRDEG